LPENNARHGFWLEQEFRAVLSYLPEYLRGPTRFAYFCGWRLGEVLALRWPHLIDETTLQIPADETKDGNRRTLVLWGELLDVIEEARARRLTSRDVLSDLIFHDDGHAIGELKKPWRLACCAADAGHFECRVCNQTLPFTIGMSYNASRRCAACGTADAVYHGRLFHDFRRTAARNMRKAGVPQSTIMATTGHKTDAMFRRYDIKDEGDLLEAQQKLQRYLQEQKPKVIAMRKGR